MLMLSNGENLYIVHDGKTRAYQDILLKSICEEYRAEQREVFEYDSSRYMHLSQDVIDIDLDLSANGFEVYEGEFDLKENWKENMTVKELLGLFNDKVNEREQ